MEFYDDVVPVSLCNYCCHVQVIKFSYNKITTKTVEPLSGFIVLNTTP